MHWVLLFFAIIGNIFANLFAKMALKRLKLETLEWQNLTKMATEPTFYLAFVSIVTALFCYMFAIIKLPLSTAYPLMSALVFVFVTIISITLFHEHVSLVKLIGIGMILIGVIIVSKF